MRLFKSVLILGVSITAALPQVLQPSVASRAEFEAASIKPADPNTAVPRPNWGPVSVNCQGNLLSLIQEAFGVERYQIRGGPTWAEKERYAVFARAGSPSSRTQIREMLAALLRSRFGLRFHEGTEIMPAYTLIVSRATPKLKASDESTPVDGAGAIQIDAKATYARGVTTRLLARFLTGELGLPVIDRTELSGGHDFTLAYGLAPAEEREDKLSAAVFALRDFGLKLESKKLPISVFIIDGAERPLPN
jgi:uncharacterized protein (TIGR03435 family)